jgi:hypothetical protein
MSQNFGWKPGPMILGGDAEKRSAPARGGRAERFALENLDKLGFSVKGMGPDPNVDIVAIDDKNHEIAIDVKTPRRQGEGLLFVTNARAPVDIHLFVEPTSAEVWAVPADVVRERGDVLKEEDVTPFKGWDALTGGEPDK